jgi:hypothetical protein
MGRARDHVLGLADLVVWPMENMHHLRRRRDAGDGDEDEDGQWLRPALPSRKLRHEQ